MPELPEVEAAKRLVDSHCLGATIVKAVVDSDNKVIDGLTAAALQEALTGRKIVGAHRKGKHMWLELDSAPWPSFQFGMSGAIIVKGVKGPSYKSSKLSDTEEFPSTYSKVHLQLDSGVEVAFTDKRRFARVRLLNDPSKVPPISELGLDAFLELPNAEDLIEAFKPKKGSVKALLMDQSFLAGIGNWVADEVLYQSKIHPEQLANSLKEEEVTRLHSAIREVLEKAVSVDADSEQFPRGWLFHHRWDKKPGLIDGHQIQQITISGRTSAFVPAVQKYSGPELKGAKTTANVADGIPHEDEAVVDLDADADTATGDVSADKAGTSETPKRGRGRPPKVKADNVATPAAAVSNDSPGVAKKRGRPPKLKNTVKTPPSVPSEGKTEVEETEKKSPAEQPKQRGRPPKAKADASKEAVSKALEEASAKGEEQDDAEPVTPKRRGRPPKSKPEAPEESEVTKKAKGEEGAATPVGTAEAKKRGRPAKPKPETDAPAAVATTPTPKKRGRPAKT